MVQIIVIGHGTYPEGVRSNLEMVVGVPEYMHFLNFTPGMELSGLERALDELLATLGDSQVLFCTDLPGATPFRVSAMRTAMAPEKYRTVVCATNMAYMELATDCDGDIADVARQVVETSRGSVEVFPGEDMPL